MKTSNKILLGIFIGIILLTTAIQLMVYAKYKRGDYTAFNRDSYDEPITKFTLPPVRYVSIIGVGICVIRNSDSTKLEVESYNDGKIAYSVKNDTLIINADLKGGNANAVDRHPISHKLVNVYVPAAVPIKAAYSNLYLGGSADTFNMPSYTVQLLQNSRLQLSRQSHEKKIKNFNLLKISSESSHIDLDDNAVVNDLHLQLTNSSIDDGKASIKSMTVNADPKSSVRLSGKNINALK
jgi:hypothetical protein